MSKRRAETNQARAQVYHALAEALAEPFPGLQEFLLAATMAGAQILGSAACRKAALRLAELPAIRIQTLGNGYRQAVFGDGKRPLALYESLFRQGRLAGEATVDVARCYQALGVSPAEGELPDHASVELAFLGYLVAAEAEAWDGSDGRLAARLRAKQRSFLRTHAAAWLPQLGHALAAGPDPFYTIVGRLLRGFLYEEVASRRRQAGQGGRVPTLVDAAACTLCGLCIGSCATDALAMVETGEETALTLDPARCVACRRCVRTCPEGVLAMAAPGRCSSAEEVPQVMRRSPRVTCPACGRPTVSQAELAAVFARLEADWETQARLSLCVDCKSVV